MRQEQGPVGTLVHLRLQDLQHVTNGDLPAFASRGCFTVGATNFYHIV